MPSIYRRLKKLVLEVNPDSTFTTSRSLDETYRFGQVRVPHWHGKDDIKERLVDFIGDIGTPDDIIWSIQVHQDESYTWYVFTAYSYKPLR